MKPLGKTMKASHHNNTNRETALKELLASYRSTPHPSTGEAPGAVLLRHGYRTEFPEKQLSDESVAAAFDHDQQQKSDRGRVINASKHTVTSQLDVGDQVIVRNQRTSKFQPIFGPDVYTITDLVNGGAVVRHNIDSTSYTRHVNDLKPAPHVAPEITWFPPSESAESPAHAVRPPAEAPVEVPVLPRRSQRNVRPPAHLSDYVVTRV